MEVYVRYLGNKACITNSVGNFVMIEREELSDAERKVCENGGGYIPMSEMVYSALQWM